MGQKVTKEIMNDLNSMKVRIIHIKICGTDKAHA